MKSPPTSVDQTAISMIMAMTGPTISDTTRIDAESKITTSTPTQYVPRDAVMIVFRGSQLQATPCGGLLEIGWCLKDDAMTSLRISRV